MSGTLMVLTNSGEAEALARRLAVVLPDVRVRTCRSWDLLSHLDTVEVLVPNGALVDEAVLRVAPRLRLVHLLGPDLAQVDLDACGRRGTYVANIPWGRRVRETGEARLVEGTEPRGDLAVSTLVRIVASNVRRLLRGQMPTFWINPPAWLDPDEAFCGRAVLARQAPALAIQAG